MKKYIFIDIDGTLLNSKGEVTEETKDAIEKAQKEGYQIVLCTGRSIRHTLRFQKKCQASSYLIVCSGGQIYD
ncbi:MAG: HAD-IIB family hydrolase, partial [Bacilli bacterium]|nr:HAD-IIB family hydrolase [Bacilli bacterium]